MGDLEVRCETAFPLYLLHVPFLIVNSYFPDVPSLIDHVHNFSTISFLDLCLHVSIPLSVVKGKEQH